MKDCPIMAIATRIDPWYISSSGARFEWGECIKDKCAWWCPDFVEGKDKGDCAIKRLGQRA